MASPETALPVQRPFGGTMRRDAWWLQPTAVFLGLGAFIVYSTWAAFQGEHYTFGNYLSPFYSPELFGDSGHAWLGPRPGWWPGWLPFSPAFLILWAPGGFRLTCYYYRGAYYKAFWADPPNCAVGEPRKSYLGERHFPLILQNVHRYFLYLALVFLLILSWDVYKALWFADPATGGEVLGLGVGTLVLATNVVLLGSYTLGCHSLRHLVGGRLNQISRKPVQKTAYSCVSCLNRRHMLFAWLSLFWVGFSDFYVRMVSMGVWTDWRIF
ncbi:MAG: succinate dehydrogenase [Gemmatimonadota bacterium]